VPPVIQNLAVPGARLQDLFTLPAEAGPRTLYTLITGGRSQVRAMIEAEPTFVSVWIGNNDALLAATGGRLGPIAAGADSALTRLAPFTANLAALADSIKASGAQGALLVGVVDPVVSVPLLQPGAYFFLARDPATGLFRGKQVNANCSPVTALGQPNPLSANLVSFQIASSAATEINCDPAAAQLGGQFLLDAAEIALVRTRVAQFNAAIQAVAAANNWAYVDPNPLFAQLAAQTTTVSGQALFQNVRKCQALATATTPAAIQSAVLRSCPVTGPTAAPNFFGSLFSFDGVHPSTAAHRILAGTFAAAINARYGTQLSTATT
jgi:lysophospholipase L1-like esterase